MKLKQTFLCLGAFTVSLWGTTLAFAQQGISVSPKAYDSALPIAAPRTIVAPVVVPVVAPPVAPQVRYEVSAGDRTIRDVLSRWARDTGWVHEPAHWALDRDFPVAASAGPEIFGTDFRAAVRTLLSSTELTDRPVQPCFYINHVVRVIPKAELCDKTVD